MSTILDQIVENKQREIELRKAQRPRELLESRLDSAPPVRQFTQTLLTSDRNVIAEIKKASPSKGVIRENFDPVDIARAYEEHNASCLSVLTDESFFSGSDEHLAAARDASTIPVLRKDFILETYQVLESRVLPADCILLIAAILSSENLHELYSYAKSLDLDVLVEIHNHDELNQAVELVPDLLGINNRNLHTFETSLDVTLSLMKEVPIGIPVISESGIHTADDVKLLRDHGVDGFLVGESLMRAENPGDQLDRLFAE